MADIYVQAVFDARAIWTLFTRCYREDRMEKENTKESKATARARRDAKLKAALKANMARRKAQTRGRKATAAAQDKAE